MEDVTERFSAFRECVRHIWNTQLRDLASASVDPWAIRDAFDDIAILLFRTIVLGPSGVSPAEDEIQPSRAAHRPALTWLRVSPQALRLPILINRDPIQDHGYWDHPPSTLEVNGADLRFVGWFDFDELGPRDLKFLLVRVVGAAQADLIGRAALVECEYVRLSIDSSAAPTLLEGT